MKRSQQPLTSKIKTALTALFRQVRPQEWGLLSLSALFSFGSVALAIFIRTWSDTLFLTHFQMSKLPIFFIWSAFAFAPVTMGYAWLSSRVSPTRLNTATLLVFSGGTLLCVYPPADRASLFVTLLLMSLVSPLVNAICWGVILERISSLQSGRLIPLISSAATLGAVTAGIIAAEVIEWGGLVALMGTITLTLIGLAWLPSLLLVSKESEIQASTTQHEPKRADQPTTPRQSQESSTAPRSSTSSKSSKSSWRTLISLISQNKLLFIIATSTLMMAITTNLIDYIFKAEVQRALTTDEIGPFLARFHAITNAGILCVQLFILGRLTERLGLKWSFPLSPTSLISVSALCLTSIGWFAFVLLRGVDTLMKFTVHSNTENLVLTPVPLVLRTQAKVVLKGAIYPLGGLIAGVLIWLMTHMDLGGLSPVTGTLYIVTSLCLIWLFSTLRVHIAYWEQLAENLHLPTGKPQREANIEELERLSERPTQSLGQLLEDSEAMTDDQVIDHVIRAFSLESHRDAVERAWSADDKTRADLIAWVSLSAQWRHVKDLGAKLERYITTRKDSTPPE